jgi:hypothetical protein
VTPKKTKIQKFVVEEPGDFPALKMAPPNKELIRLQRTMRAICKNSPYHTKPASQDRGAAAPPKSESLSERSRNRNA